jgi:lipid A disaccharide synthetase
VGRRLTRALTAWQLRRRPLLALPNIAAGRAVVPERLGLVTPEQIASETADWLARPERLAAMAADLRRLRGAAGAVPALADLVDELLPWSPGPA